MLYTKPTLLLALHMMMWGLHEAALMKHPTCLCAMLLPEAVWNSVANDATGDLYVLCASALIGHAMWVCVVFHFTIIALKVDQGRLVGLKFHKLTCGKGDILWQCLKSLSSLFIPVGVAETPNLNNYMGCPLTFGHVIVVFCTINWTTV